MAALVCLGDGGLNTYAAAPLGNFPISIGWPRRGAMLMAGVHYSVCVQGGMSLAGGREEPRSGKLWFGCFLRVWSLVPT
jgi:hypothetical protein